MIIYMLSNEVRQHIADGKVTVHSYSYDNKKGNLSVILTDSVLNKHIKVIFHEPSIENEKFEIAGKKVTNLIIKRHVKVYSTEYFSAMYLSVSDGKEEVKIWGND